MRANPDREPYYLGVNQIPPAGGTPRIGITADPDYDVAEYEQAVRQAGGEPVRLMPDVTRVAADLAGLHGLILSGGDDIDPSRYGAAPHARTEIASARRDDYELALVQAALELQLPVLAICRGLQVANVALGGTLHQHVPDIVEHREHQPEGGAFSDMDVTTVPGTVTAAIFGDKATVRCSHHQAVERLGEGLMVSARSVADGLVEAAELPRARFVVGVQWHPEEGRDLRPFRALVDAVR